jgi:hypothetical protein
LVKGATLRPATPSSPKETNPSEGDTFDFGPGAHSFSVRAWDNAPIPPNLTFEGAGMDRTLVTFDRFQSANVRFHTEKGAVVNLAFRDMTVDCGNDKLFDYRTKDPTTLRFERCRIIRFDSGAGGSSLFHMRSLAVWMKDTRIENGYGRSPQHGKVFAVQSDSLLALLDDCTIVGATIEHVGGGATVLLRRCRLTDVRPWTGPEDLAPRAAVRLEGCTVEPPMSREAWSEKFRRPRPLTDINPDWKDVR